MLRSSLCLPKVLGFALLTLSAAPVVHAQLATVSPVFVDYGRIKMGATVLVPITVWNPNEFALSLAGGSVGANNGFSNAGGTCAASIAPNSKCTLLFSFQPRSSTQTVGDSAEIELTGDGLSQSVLLSFLGTGSESLVQISPRGIDFGEQPVGTTVSIPVTITNTHNEAVDLAGGGIAPPFSGSSLCGGSLAAGASCEYLYSFTAGQVAEVSGIASIQASESSGMVQNFSIEVAGRGRTTTGLIKVVPVKLDFGDIKVGSQVESRVFATNLTSNTMSRGGGGFNDNDNAFKGFTASEAGCGANMQPVGTTCSFEFQFLPREPRAHAAITSLQFSQAGNTVSVPLQFAGFGVGTLARVSPIEVDFGEVPTGTLVSVPVIVSNTSGTSLTSLTGSDVSGGFSKTTNCGYTLTTGSKCAIVYSFQPDSATTYDIVALLSYTNATGTQEEVEITLSGSGTARLFGNGFE